MSQNGFQYFIGIGLPPKEDKFFGFLKQQFHPKGNLSSPAHITIIPPFYYENESWLVQKLESWAKSQKPFKTEFEQVASFIQPKYGTVYFAPDKGEHFKHIFNSIHEAVPHLPRKHGGEFVPHLTIANRTPLDQISEIKKTLKDMGVKLELHVKKIVIYRRKTNENWNNYKELMFDGEI
jgi:2'-5' RNA ligase